MQCVGEIHALFAPLQRLNNHRGLLNFDVGKAAQFTKRIYHDVSIKAIQAAQHPFGFKENGFRDEYRFLFEQCSRSFALLGIVIGKQSYQYIGINRVHDEPWFLS